MSEKVGSPLNAASVRSFVLLIISAMTGIVGCSPAPKVEPPQAIFLIVVDTLRPDRLSTYGYTAIQTPAIDLIATNGVLFTDAQSVASWTVPSMGAMMTSRYPTQLGLVEAPDTTEKQYKWREKRRQLNYTLPEEFTTLAEVLSDADYHTAAFVNQPFINTGDGFVQGFDEWCYPTAEDTIAWHDTAQPMPRLNYSEGTDIGKADALLAAEFRRWLGRHSRERSFVWLHLLTPHWPYTPSLRYLGPDPQSWRNAPATDRYDLEVREVDDIVGAILNAIETTVSLGNSLVVFTSDHGEAFGEHRMQEHGHTLHREVTQVPLMIAGRNVPRQVRVESTVRSLDVLPTILEMAGLEDAAPPGMEGSSLVETFGGGVGNRVVYSEGMLYGSTERSLTAGGFKLMFDQQGPDYLTLFDCKADPHETEDLSQSNPDRRDEMWKVLTDLHGRLVKDFNTAGTGKRLSADDEDVLRSMKALGYVNE